MCVILATPFTYRGCTLKDESRHTFSNTRVITQEVKGMPEDIRQKLDCKNEKTENNLWGDPCCKEITEWKVPFGSTSKRGRCPACAESGLYPDTPKQQQNAFFLPYDTYNTLPGPSDFETSFETLLSLMDDPPFDAVTLKKQDLICVGLGLSSEVVRILGTNIVAKIPAPQALDGRDVEKRIYERLDKHPNVLRYLGQSPPECDILKSGLLFEYQGRGTLADNIDRLNSVQERGSWPIQVVSAVAYIHSKEVVHGDISLDNFLLNDDGMVVLCDFAGSGLDELPPNVSGGVRYSNPLLEESGDPSKADDVFALGTVLYEIDRGERLFDGKTEVEIRQRLRDKMFPDLLMVSQSLRRVIRRCWEDPSYGASDALLDLTPPLSIPYFSWLLKTYKQILENWFISL